MSKAIELAAECGLLSDTVHMYADEIETFFRRAQAMALRDAVVKVETYRVSVGNSRAGELAAEWTMENLRELREELRRMADELEAGK